MKPEIRNYHENNVLLTDEERLAAMISTGIEPQHGGGDLWEVHHPKGGRWFVSALTGKMNEIENYNDCVGDFLIIAMERTKSAEDCLPEAKQRIDDYEEYAGDVEKCLRLIEERKGDRRGIKIRGSSIFRRFGGLNN